MIGEILDHLWQSTCIAGALGFATWVFRSHGAHVRHALWFAASVKFLLPFSLLIALGARIPLQSRAAAPALSQIVAPFSSRSAPAFLSTPLRTAGGRAVSAPTPPQGRLRQLVGPMVLAAWALGCAIILARWITRWVKIRRALRQSSPFNLSAPIPVRSSSGTLEPGVVGVFSPVLLMPAGIERHLDPVQMQSIVLHEMAHVRRRDNLTACIQMLVETLFWFYPLVWWIGGCLLREREGACDEAVIAAGCSPAAYAEGILKVCRFYLQSPLACAAGVAGADLKRRIEAIMTPRRLRQLGAVGTSLISGAAFALLMLPVLLGAVLAVTSRAEAQQQEVGQSIRQTVQLLSQGSYAQLDERMNGFQTAYRRGALADTSLLREFYAFTLADPGLDPNFDTWVAAYPTSYAARLARAIHYFGAGVQTRGSQFSEHTTSEQWRGMKIYLDKARQDLQDSLTLDPKPMLSYSVLMRVVMQLGEPETVRTLFESAVALDPQNLVARTSYMRSMETRFSGSLDQMIAFLQSSRDAGLSADQLVLLQKMVANEREWLKGGGDTDKRVAQGY
jgi:beta-lactamase regulating signal transducer with metallopeptidase domain